MPTVSVIVPNYNHARYLPKRIESILRQTYQDFELVLLDDCSADDSCAVLSQYASDPRVRLEFNETNSDSTFRQWNKGARLARGKYVWIAESDDYAGAKLLERLVSPLDADPEVAFAYCRSWRVLNEDGNLRGFADSYVDPAHSRWQSDFCVDGREECADYFTRGTPVPNTSAVVFRREAYDRVGGADENLRICGDWKLWAAMALTGKVAYVSEPLNYYRTHDATVRNAIWGKRHSLDARYAEERLKVARWILDRATPNEATLQKAYRDHSRQVVPIIVSPRVPVRSKRALIRLIMEFDSHRGMARAALREAPAAAWGNTVWSIRNYAWHPILNWTRAIRHSMGLNHDNVHALLKRNPKQMKPRC